MAKNESVSANRRSDIISAAIEVFAEAGYYRTTTAQVAQRAGISQPYVFRFFATKEALLLAALEASWERVAESFRQVIASSTGERLERELISAYERILSSHRQETLLQMQAQTMLEEPIRTAMKAGLGEVRRLVQDSFRAAGIPDPEDRTMLFLARGMLCNVSMALNMPELMKG
ncbi:MULTISPECIES: TetR/AcrR family transcriptional regulator [unclassified Paenibacillus]|uniref:TetR/AcrR family transcriptional regulator n=1 Tax=unclassified Paenibacillus TaxID=185978 RepID=UPI000953DAB7|nr:MULTISPECIES: TetR/AcrR family transcriptional regulator [unclassified Paenibacillus]ASS67562.1 TetR/AcrR family transcriptional regulator [Paenibacillus sp. RUD330]SIQ72693.1 transcriptional regulator, TetR family [Paenibacillus sp. RU4X]SIQ94156.1 transcriptional regulator, TetR family [Paenibacillus sp. RU4T]